MNTKRIPITLFLDELEWIIDYATDDPNGGKILYFEKILKNIRERNKLPPTVLQP
jgi:hypothetical protein